MVFFQTLKNSVKMQCKCHGVSGHCSTQFCWQTTPSSLKKVSLQLKHMYKNSRKIKHIAKPPNTAGGGGRKTRTESRKPRDSSQGNPRTNTIKDNFNHNNNHNNLTTGLVHLTDSPDYCHPDPELGTPGTLGRECDNNNEDSCKKLCNQCGYRKHSYVKIKRDAICNCKFIWCCEVTCETCTERNIYAKCAS